MNIGYWFCIILVPCFALIGLLFGIFKENAAKYVSGFNSLPQKEQELYDKALLAKDMRNSCFLWALIMLAGAIGSLLLSACFAILAYVVWGILFIKDIHIDARKAFKKYLRDQP